MRAIDLYLQNPTKDNLRDVVMDNRKIIDSVVRGIAGSQVSPIVRRRAYVMAADAASKFNPNIGVPFEAFLRQQLMQLVRVNRQVSEVVTVPERFRRDQAALYRAREALWDKLDREPTPEELADYTGINVRRQERLQGLNRNIMSTGAMDDAVGDNESTSFDPMVTRVDPMQEIYDYLYHDMDPVDRRIFSVRTGYRNTPAVPNTELARELKLSPGAVSQRANAITRRIDRIMAERMEDSEV